MSLQKIRSEVESIQASYVTIEMQLKLVLGYLTDEVPETTLSRQFLGEAKKMASELVRSLSGLRETFVKIDGKLGKNITKKADKLHEFISSSSDGLIETLDRIDIAVLANNIPKATELLESLRASLEQNEEDTALVQEIDWGLLEGEDLAKPDVVQKKKKKKRKKKKEKSAVVLIYSTSPDDEYLVERLVGRFLRKLDIEPIYVSEEAQVSEKSLEDSHRILVFITKGMTGPEKCIVQQGMGARRKTIVYVEAGADVPNEIKNIYELKYFSRDRTGELLIEIMDAIEQ